MTRAWIVAAIVLGACGGSKPPTKPPPSQGPASSSSVPMQGIDDDIPAPIDVDDDEH
jgi:hypothetical protein